MTTFGRGRERVVLELTNGDDESRIFLARDIRLVDGLVHFTCKSKTHVATRDHISNAIEVESGHFIPSLSRSGRYGAEGGGEWVHFARALTIELVQATERGMVLPFILCRINRDRVTDGMRMTLSRMLEHSVRWYDVVSELDASTIAILLPGCRRQDADRVVERLSQRPHFKSLNLEISWRSGQVRYLVADAAQRFPSTVFLDAYQLALPHPPEDIDRFS